MGSNSSDLASGSDRSNRSSYHGRNSMMFANSMPYGSLGQPFDLMTPQAMPYGRQQLINQAEPPLNLNQMGYQQQPPPPSPQQQQQQQYYHHQHFNSPASPPILPEFQNFYNQSNNQIKSPSPVQNQQPYMLPQQSPYSSPISMQWQQPLLQQPHPAMTSYNPAANNMTQPSQATYQMTLNEYNGKAATPVNHYHNHNMYHHHQQQQPQPQPQPQPQQQQHPDHLHQPSNYFYSNPTRGPHDRTSFYGTPSQQQYQLIDEETSADFNSRYGHLFEDHSKVPSAMTMINRRRRAGHGQSKLSNLTSLKDFVNSKQADKQQHSVAEAAEPEDCIYYHKKEYGHRKAEDNFIECIALTFSQSYDSMDEDLEKYREMALLRQTTAAAQQRRRREQQHRKQPLIVNHSDFDANNYINQSLLTKDTTIENISHLFKKKSSQMDWSYYNYINKEQQQKQQASRKHEKVTRRRGGNAATAAAINRRVSLIRREE